MGIFCSAFMDVSLVVAAFILYVLLWFIKKQELMKSTGVDANVIFNATRPIQKYFGVMERLMTVSIVLIIAVHYLVPDDIFLTTRLFGAGVYINKIIGFVFCIIGLAICRLAQVTIGKSWRVGIDENAKPGLITNGIYGVIRNPTYTGLFILCTGVFVILPTVLISYWILAFFIMMEFQVRCEEEYLEKQYGNEYLQYLKKTSRYIPFIY
ncbi:MAG: isoprenylcysteine carboxylmethyltransferase family protein [Spirochaetae bacterium HGW-Spirochaetae-5]|nr:MAG: isoprenylcysteine carboxylmethyltransferase family protein [Spirochaetae bacterium HGW-Spirochaetae-5]